MKKRNDIKKEVKKIKKTEDSKLNKRRNKKEPDLWKEIHSYLKPLGKAYNKFREKRRIAKQKEEERKLKEEEKQRLEEKRIIEERDERIRQEQIYRERLKKGEEVRIEQLKRVNNLREEERKLRD